MYFLVEELRLPAFDLRRFFVVFRFMVYLPDSQRVQGGLVVFDLYWRLACVIMYPC